MTLRVLPQTLVNRIAAGEVLERPSSAVKELVENALDAGAHQIDVVLRDGGKSFLSVTDDGKGMTKEEISLSLERFATSKLPSEDLFNLDFLGFRGEALPSIASVSRLTLISRQKDSDTAWSVFVEGGEKHPPEPASSDFGTRVEVRDLFYAVPARLKFLKTIATETSVIKEMLEKIALAYPKVGFSLSDEKKKRLDFKVSKQDAGLERLKDVLGKDFVENALEVNTSTEMFSLKGFIGLPTMNKSTSAGQYFFVNGRSVKDKLLFGAVKGAYREVLASDRFPVLVLFLEVQPEEVDVNVHPTKAEVRFRNPQHIRSVLISAIRQALVGFKHRTASTLGTDILEKSIATNPYSYPQSPSYNASGFQTPRFYSGKNKTPSSFQRVDSYPSSSYATSSYSSLKEPPSLFGVEETYSLPVLDFKDDEPDLNGFAQSETSEDFFPPLGLAKAQLHQTYIIAQTKEGIVIVDQHAAHERLTYEKLKENMEKNQGAAQYLLMSEIVALNQEQKEALLLEKPQLDKLGFLFEPFGQTEILVRATPSLLGEVDVKQLSFDMAETLLEFGETLALTERIKKIVATMACHGSIRAGRKLDISQMNALLRQMEEGSFSGQCIHGRPTYVELKLKDIEKLFGRIE